MEKLTEQQIGESKILIQRYFKLDNEKEAVRLKLEEIIPKELKEILTAKGIRDIQWSLTADDSEIEKSAKVDIPYILENYIDNHAQWLNEEIRIDHCSECGSEDITQTEGRSLSDVLNDYGHVSAQYKCNSCKWEFGENEWHDVMEEKYGSKPDV